MQTWCMAMRWRSVILKLLGLSMAMLKCGFEFRDVGKGLSGIRTCTSHAVVLGAIVSCTCHAVVFASRVQQ